MAAIAAINPTLATELMHLTTGGGDINGLEQIELHHLPANGGDLGNLSQPL
jgi:hypothetical protein